MGPLFPRAGYYLLHGVFFLNSNWCMNNFALPPIVLEIKNLMLFESLDCWKKQTKVSILATG